jgi:hypothetical protein
MECSFSFSSRWPAQRTAVQALGCVRISTSILSENQKLQINNFSPPVGQVACNRWLGTLRLVVVHELEKGNLVVL